MSLIKLKTIYGDLDIHLFTDDSPINTKKFLKLCLQGFYDYLPFSRYEEKFILQTSSSEMDDSMMTKLETSPNLKFDRRALVAMVSIDEKGSSAGDIFITLSPTPELNRKSTIIGEIYGDSVHLLTKLEDNYHPHLSLIIGMKVINHPWDDITLSNISKRDTKRISLLKPIIDEYLGISTESKQPVLSKEISITKRKKSLLSFDVSSSEEEEDNKEYVKKKNYLKEDGKRIREEKDEGDEGDDGEGDDGEGEENDVFNGDLIGKQTKENTEIEKEILALQKEILNSEIKVIPQITPKERISSLSKLLGHRVKLEAGCKDNTLLDKDAILSAFKEKLSSLNTSSGDDDDGIDDKDDEASQECALHSLKKCQSCNVTLKKKERKEKPFLSHRLLFEDN